MANITAKEISALREATGVGMMECKRALLEADGDMQKAIVILRERGLAAAAKKASRVAAEGMVYATVCESCGIGAVIEVNVETDFASSNEKFVEFVKTLGGLVIEKNPADIEALKALTYPGTSDTVAAILQNMVLTIGENIQIRRLARYEGGEGIVNGSYIHMKGKIGVLVRMQVSAGLEKNAEVAQLCKDLCMQVAAMRPSWVDRSEVPADRLAAEKEILMSQAINEGKPAAVAEKIVMGRLGKFYEEFCLLDQAFIRDNKISIARHIKSVEQAVGSSIKVLSFVRFERGEGIEKKKDDFAEEVTSMVK